MKLKPKQASFRPDTLSLPTLELCPMLSIPEYKSEPTPVIHYIKPKQKSNSINLF